MQTSAVIKLSSNGVGSGFAKRVAASLTQLLLLSLCAATASAAQQGCNRLWEMRTLSSDSNWVAVVHQDVCDVGLGSAVDEYVELRENGASKAGKVIAVPSGEWKNPDAVKLRWLGPKLLEISVPNRTILHSRLCRYKDIAIRVRYRQDNPEDRARWLAWVQENLEWAKSSLGRQPQLPPLPDSDTTDVP
jgi:hypothetical protein